MPCPSMALEVVAGERVRRYSERMSKAASEGREISARWCGPISIVTAGFWIWVVTSTMQSGGNWGFSMLGIAVPLLFAIQGLRLSREPQARWRTFSLVTSICGAVLAVAALVAVFGLLAVSSPGR